MQNTKKKSSTGATNSENKRKEKLVTYESMLECPPKLPDGTTKAELLRSAMHDTYAKCNDRVEFGGAVWDESELFGQLCGEMREAVKSRRPKERMAESDAEEVMFKLIWYLVANGKIRK